MIVSFLLALYFTDFNASTFSFQLLGEEITNSSNSLACGVRTSDLGEMADFEL